MFRVKTKHDDEEHRSTTRTYINDDKTAFDQKYIPMSKVLVTPFYLDFGLFRYF